MAIDTIKEIKKQIVAKIEKGEDVSELSHQLAEERAKIIAHAEIEELQKVADARQALKEDAEKVKTKIRKQEAAIDKFLSLRDDLARQLQPLIEPMRELAKMQSMHRDGWGECYSSYIEIGGFTRDVARFPGGYLPVELGCPFVTMKGGKDDVHGKAQEAFNYLSFACGIISNFEKTIVQPPNRKPAEGLMAIDNEPETGGCLVCTHSEIGAINKQLKEGKSLRHLEAEFKVSRSTLSRHKRLCLNLGAIKIMETSNA